MTMNGRFWWGGSSKNTRGEANCGQLSQDQAGEVGLFFAWRFALLIEAFSQPLETELS